MKKSLRCSLFVRLLSDYVLLFPIVLNEGDILNDYIEARDNQAKDVYSSSLPLIPLYVTVDSVSFNGNPSVNGYSAIVKAATDGTGYIIWKDDSDILYSISILKNTSHFARESFAVEVSASEKLVQLGEEICSGLES